MIRRKGSRSALALSGLLVVLITVCKLGCDLDFAHRSDFQFEAHSNDWQFGVAFAWKPSSIPASRHSRVSVRDTARHFKENGQPPHKFWTIPPLPLPFEEQSKIDRRTQLLQTVGSIDASASVHQISQSKYGSTQHVNPTAEIRRSGGRTTSLQPHFLSSVFSTTDMSIPTSSGLPHLAKLGKAPSFTTRTKTLPSTRERKTTHIQSARSKLNAVFDKNIERPLFASEAIQSIGGGKKRSRSLPLLSHSSATFSRATKPETKDAVEEIHHEFQADKEVLCSVESLAPGCSPIEANADIVIRRSQSFLSSSPLPRKQASSIDYQGKISSSLKSLVEATSIDQRITTDMQNRANLKGAITHTKFSSPSGLSILEATKPREVKVVSSTSTKSTTFRTFSKTPQSGSSEKNILQSTKTSVVGSSKSNAILLGLAALRKDAEAKLEAEKKVKAKQNKGRHAEKHHSFQIGRSTDPLDQNIIPTIMPIRTQQKADTSIPLKSKTPPSRRRPTLSSSVNLKEPGDQSLAINQTQNESIEKLSALAAASEKETTAKRNIQLSNFQESPDKDGKVGRSSLSFEIRKQIENEVHDESSVLSPPLSKPLLTASPIEILSEDSKTLTSMESVDYERVITPFNEGKDQASVELDSTLDEEKIEVINDKSIEFGPKFFTIAPLPLAEEQIDSSPSAGKLHSTNGSHALPGNGNPSKFETAVLQAGASVNEDAQMAELKGLVPADFEEDDLEWDDFYSGYEGPKFFTIAPLAIPSDEIDSNVSGSPSNSEQRSKQYSLKPPSYPSLPDAQKRLVETIPKAARTYMLGKPISGEGTTTDGDLNEDEEISPRTSALDYGTSIYQLAYADDLSGDSKGRERFSTKDLFGNRLIREPSHLDKYTDYSMYTTASVESSSQRIATHNEEHDRDQNDSLSSESADHKSIVSRQLKQQSRTQHRYTPPLLPYYKVLGVPMAATQEQIKEAYRYLVKYYHPDSKENLNRDTSKQFSKLNRAYEVLTDPVLKSQYDQFGQKGIGTSAASDALKLLRRKDVVCEPGKQEGKTSKKIPPLLAKTKSPKVSSPPHSAGDSNDVHSFSIASNMKQLKVPVQVKTSPTNRNYAKQDLYKILLLQRGATSHEIQHSYNVLSKHLESKGNTKLLYKVRNAYKILNNHEQKRKYDMYGFEGLDLSGRGEPSADTEKLVEQNPITKGSGVSAIQTFRNKTSDDDSVKYRRTSCSTAPDYAHGPEGSGHVAVVQAVPPKLRDRKRIPLSSDSETVASIQRVHQVTSVPETDKTGKPVLAHKVAVAKLPNNIVEKVRKPSDGPRDDVLDQCEDECDADGEDFTLEHDGPKFFTIAPLPLP